VIIVPGALAQAGYEAARLALARTFGATVAAPPLDRAANASGADDLQENAAIKGMEVREIDFSAPTGRAHFSVIISMTYLNFKPPLATCWEASSSLSIGITWTRG
jgi:hypothetical protein